MSNDERMDEQLRRFLDWQAGQLDGTPDAHGMALRIGRRSAARTADRPRLVWAIVAVALVAALAAAAALVGSRLIERPPTGGLLAYAMNDDIYLADQDGAHPRKVADGVPWTNAGGGPSYMFGDGGPAWAPDGRHFLFFDLQGAAAQLTGHIADASGHVVASIPNIWVDATWSPDSTRIEAWTGGSEWIGTTQISIYGIDGALEESLAFPPATCGPASPLVSGRPTADRCTSVSAKGVGQPAIGSCRSMGRRRAASPRTTSSPALEARELLARRQSHGRERRRFAGRGQCGRHRPSRPWPGGRVGPRWSPTGTHVAHRRVTDADAQTFDITVVDITSGADRTVATGLKINGLGLLGWSPAGDRVLFAGLDHELSSLWSVRADGTDRKLLVPGAAGGEWQPQPIP